MSLASIDLTVVPILAELKTNQDAAYLKNTKYAQLFATHDVTPEVATDVKVSLVRDEDIRPTLPAQLDFAFRVDENQYPGSCGWVMWVWAMDGGKQYVKAFPQNCPDDKEYPSDWVETPDGPVS